MVDHKTNIEDAYPLSAMQQGMLYHSQFSPRSGAYIEQLVCHLFEQLDVLAFAKSWQTVSDRHPILRTAFRWDGLDEPLQQVYRDAVLPFEQHDWQNLIRSDQEDRLDAYLHRDRLRGFDMSEPPLSRLALFQVAGAEYTCVWTFHHALLDGQSLWLLLNEIFDVYRAFRQDQPPPRSQNNPYRSYIDWLGAQDFDQTRPYWRQTLEGFTAPTSIAPPGAQTQSEEQYGHQDLWIPERVTAQLKALAEQNQLTLNNLVQGAWALLLSRYSGEEDIVFGVTRRCRSKTLESVDSIVGLLINTVPLRVHVPPDLALIPWLHELRTQWTALRDYEHTPLVEIQRWSELPPGKPLFDSILVFENYQFNDVLRAQGGEWENRSFRLLEQVNYPLTLAGYAGRQLWLRFEYDLRRMDHNTVERMLGHLQTLLNGMVEQPEAKLFELPLLTAPEQRQILKEWNSLTGQYPQDKCLHHLFEEQVEREPQAVAVVHQGQSLTFAELNRRANQLAHHLVGLGVGPDKPVGLCVERSLDLVVGLMGILKAGGAYVPMDPDYPLDRLNFMLQDSKAMVLIAQDQLLERLGGIDIQVVCLDTEWQAIAQAPDDNLMGAASPENLSYILYTSGSTGKPKGVMVTHRNVVAMLYASDQVFRPGWSAAITTICTICFDASVWEIFSALCLGGALHIILPDLLMDAESYGAYLVDNEITGTYLYPGLLPALLEQFESYEQLRQRSKLLMLMTGLEPKKDGLLQRCRDIFGRLQIVNAYGPTEITVMSSFYDFETTDEPERYAPIGIPFPNYQMYILDPFLQPLPVGVIGEIWIGGVGVARGYFNRPEINAEMFIPDPFSDHPEARLYKSGDLGYFLPDGNINFLGRSDSQVKLRGYRIELGEIEANLEEHPAVNRAVVLMRGDEHSGKQLVAYVVTMTPDNPKSEALRDFLKEKLPEYMLPAFYVRMEALPLLPNGKIDRKTLPEPDRSRLELQAEFVSPRNAMEDIIADIWRRVLKLEKIGIHDNFFDLGGQSLLVMRVFSQIKEQIGAKIPVATIFEAPTVAQLAVVIAQGEGAHRWKILAPINPKGEKPPFFCVHGLIGEVIGYGSLARRLGADQPLYGLQARGLSGSEPPHNSIPDMAAEYVSELIKVQPQGPYYLGGFCIGGVVAFEMANQLVGQGQRVALLALFDSYAPEIAVAGAFRWRPHQIAHALYNTPLELHNLWSTNPERRWIRFRRNLRSLVKRLAARLGFSTADTALDRLNWRAAYLTPDQREVQLGLIQAQLSYIPPLYPGRVTLFRARSIRLRRGYDPELGWGILAQGGVDLNILPSYHRDMLHDPVVGVLGETLRSKIKQAVMKTPVSTRN